MYILPKPTRRRYIYICICNTHTLLQIPAQFAKVDAMLCVCMYILPKPTQCRVVMSRLKHMQELCHIHEWDHVLHSTCFIQGSFIYQWVASTMYMSQVTCRNGTTYINGTTYFISRVSFKGHSYINESRQRYTRVVSHTWMGPHVSFHVFLLRVIHKSISCVDDAGWRGGTWHVIEWVMSCMSCTACCMSSVISSVSNLNRWSSSLGLIYHVPLKRDQGDQEWTLRFNETLNAIGCIISHFSCLMSHFSRLIFHIQPIAFGVSCNLNLQSQSHWSLFNGTWWKRPRERDHRLRFENSETTLQMQQAVSPIMYRMAETHRMPYLYMSFSAKEPYK